MIALAVALLALAGSTAHAATAAAPVVFSDPTGDNGTGPDITQISVGNDQAGSYEFDVSFATDYGPNAQLFVYLDTDKNGNTGDQNQDGADYALFDDHATHTFELDSWSGTDWAQASAKTVDLTIASNNRSLQLKVNKSELGNTTAFNFVVYAVDGASNADSGYFDDAPSGSGLFSYAYQLDPLKLTYVTSKSVVSGREWTVAMAVRRSDTNALQGSDGTIGCHSNLPVVTRAWVTASGNAGSAAVCTFKLPKAKKGKKVTYTATVTIGADGATVSKTFTIKA